MPSLVLLIKDTAAEQAPLVNIIPMQICRDGDLGIMEYLLIDGEIWS